MTGRDIVGTYFPPRSAKSLPARIVRDGSGLALRTDSGTLPIDLDNVGISGRIGRTPRRITFADQSLFETPDNDGVDELFFGDRPNVPAVLLARMENIRGRLWPVVVIVTSLAIGGVVWCFPLLTNFAAEFVSRDWEAHLGMQTMDNFDGYIFHASELDAQRQDSIQKIFRDLADRAHAAEDTPVHYELVFRKGGEVIGANALALPGGIIIVTDELVNLAPSDDALAGVLAHEMGHVAGRHSIKLYVYDQTMNAVMLLMGVSDSSSFGVTANVTALLLEQGYSRDFEREADAHAVRLLREAGRPPDALADMFEVLAKACEPHCDDVGWISSHPAFAERIEAARGHAKQAE